MNSGINASVAPGRDLRLPNWAALVVIGIGMLPVARAAWLAIELAGTIGGVGSTSIREVLRLMCGWI